MACFSLNLKEELMMVALLASYVAPKVLATLGTVLGIILADFVFGILVSLRNGNFQVSKLPQFVETSLIPYIGGLLALALFSNVNAELGALFFTIAATITVKFLADITTKVTQLFSGIQIQLQSPIAVNQNHSGNPSSTTPDQPEPANPAANSSTEVTQ